MSWFQNLFDARRKIAAWRTDYNEERPHSSLGYQTPKEFAMQAARFYRAELGQEASNAGENQADLLHALATTCLGPLLTDSRWRILLILVAGIPNQTRSICL